MLLSYSKGRRSGHLALRGLMLDAKRRYAFAPHSVHPPCLKVRMSLSNAVHPPCQRQDVFRGLKGCGHKNGDCFRTLWTMCCHLHSRPIVLIVVGCSDGSIVVATLAHELFWTFGCRVVPLSHQSYGFYTCSIDECLHYADCLSGCGHSYQLPSLHASIDHFTSAS
jgi:hypothetical protein